MIRHEITLHSNFQIKSFIEISEGIITTQEFYNKKGQPIKTHIKDNKHITYKKGKPIKTIRYWENSNQIKSVEEIKYGYSHVIEFNVFGRRFRKAKFKYHPLNNNPLHGVDIRYNHLGYIEQKSIYKNGKRISIILYNYHNGGYNKQIGNRKITGTITPKMLSEIAPTWEQDFKHLTVGTKCEFIRNDDKLFSSGIITRILNWYQVEIIDEFGGKNIVSLYYVSIDSE